MSKSIRSTSVIQKTRNNFSLVKKIKNVFDKTEGKKLLLFTKQKFAFDEGESPHNDNQNDFVASKSLGRKDNSMFHFIEREKLKTKLESMKDISKELLDKTLVAKSFFIKGTAFEATTQKSKSLVEDINHFSQRMEKYFAKSRYSFSKDLLDRIDTLHTELNDLKAMITGEGEGNSTQDIIDSISSFYDSITSNKELMHEIECVTKHSITLDTYKIGNVKFSEDAKTYEDEYQYKNSNISKVKHFGINGKKVDVSQDKLLINDNGVSVKLSKLSYKPDVINQIQHENVEIDLIQEALQYLNTGVSKVVLVDIFARHITTDATQNGKIKIDKYGKPEIHNVVLYKLNAESVLLIDPSNYYFSSHIANMNSEGVDIGIKVPTQKGYKIYSPISSNKLGSESNQWRDCLDVAVKLAFGFNKNGIIEGDSILSNKTVVSITNNDKIDNGIFYSKKLPTRKKQQSDPDKVEKFNKKITDNKKIFDECRKLIQVKKAEADKKLEDICYKDLLDNGSLDLNDQNIILNECFSLGVGSENNLEEIS